MKSLNEDFPEGIPQCGSDALRFGLLAYTVQGNDVNLDIKRVVGYRQFCNKIWNAIKFALTYVNDFEPFPGMVKEVVAVGSAAGVRDRSILSKLNTLIALVDEKMTAYVFGDVVNALYSWFMNDFCDVYLELVKPVVIDDSEANAPSKRCVKITLYHCLETFLRLIHPMMPFVSEELWQRLPNRESLTKTPSIMIASYPEPDAILENNAAEADVGLIMEAVRSARHTRVEYKVPVKATPTFYYSATGSAMDTMPRMASDFETLVKCAKGTFSVAPSPVPDSCCVVIVNDRVTLYMDMAGSIDKEQEIARLSKEKARLEPKVDEYERKARDPEYEIKVPEKVRELNAQKLKQFKTELDGVLQALEKLSA